MPAAPVLRELITEACGLLRRCEHMAAHDLPALTELELLRSDLLIVADGSEDQEAADDACETVDQINALLRSIRRPTPLTAKAS